MDVKELEELLQCEEGPRLEFKRDFYDLNHPKPQVKEWEWGEFITLFLNENVQTEPVSIQLVAISSP